MSFFYAVRGVGDAIIDETHLRFHLVAAFYVLLHAWPSVYWDEKAILLGVLIDALVSFVLLIGARVAMLIVYDWVVAHSDDKRKRVLVYGVSDKSVALTTRLFKSPHYRIAGFLTYGTEMSGYKVSEHKTYYFRNEEEFNKAVAVLKALFDFGY